MKIKLFFLILLCILILLPALTGCSSSDDGNSSAPDDYPYDPSGPSVPETGGPTHHSSVFDNALSAFPPVTVMATTSAGTLTWAELFVFLHRTVSNIMYSYGESFDWNEGEETGESLADFVLEYATDEALSFLAYAYGFNALGFSLGSDDLNFFIEDINEFAEMYGGKEELEKSLRESGGFYDLEVFEKLYKIEYSIGILINELYGDDANAFPDERAAEYAEEHGYMMAMHILRLKIEGDDTPLEESEDLLVQLNNHRDSGDLLEVFIDLMNEFSEDPGSLQSYPDGYLFQFTDMVEPFSIATAALETGQMSDIVETVYGYHIILRIPIDYDTIPIGFSNAGIFRTLRQAAALADFDTMMLDWIEALKPEFTPEYKSIDLAVIFKLD